MWTISIVQAGLQAETGRLEKAGRIDMLRLLHFHIGSQVPNIITIKNAVIEATRCGVAGMAERGTGTIIFVLGSESRSGPLQYAAYNASKVAQRALAESVAYEFMHRGVHAVALDVDGAVEPRVEGHVGKEGFRAGDHAREG